MNVGRPFRTVISSLHYTRGRSFIFPNFHTQHMHVKTGYSGIISVYI